MGDDDGGPALQHPLQSPLDQHFGVGVDVGGRLIPDDDPRVAYFRQMDYGLYVRMALLAMVLGKA